jgi:hypothetical protein
VLITSGENVFVNCRNTLLLRRYFLLDSTIELLLRILSSGTAKESISPYISALLGYGSISSTRLWKI